MTKAFLRLFSLTIAATVLVAACNALPTNEPRVRTELVTVVVVWSPTPDPNFTPPVQIITATVDRTQVRIPDGVVPTERPQDADDTADDARTGTRIADDDDPAIVNIGDDDDNDLPDGCIRHIVDSGDTVFGIAEEYEADGFAILEVNQLDDETATQLQIGDELIVPLESCPIDQLLNVPTAPPTTTDTPEVSLTPTETQVTVTNTPAITATPTVTPTITLPATAADAQIDIMGIVDAGDVTAEGVRIVNPGSIVRIDGWRISDADGNEYVFGEQMLFSNSELTLYTRDGQDTVIARFWGLEEPVWQSGDVVTLTDARGVVQAVYRVP
jgi:hypothetical protein